MPREPRVPWWVLGVLIVVWFVFNGFAGDQLLARTVTLVVFFATPVALIALVTTYFALRASWHAQTIERVRQASGLTISAREARRFAAAVEEITLHFSGRDPSRVAPEPVEIPLSAHAPASLRIEWRQGAPRYAAVISAAAESTG